MESISRKQLVKELAEYADTLSRGIVLAIETDCDAIEAHFRREVAVTRAFIAHLQNKAAESPSACENDAPASLVVAKPKSPRCAHYKAIRRVFAIAREKGLDTRADEAMRAAFGNYLCVDVPSRETLTGSDWKLVGDAIKARRLVW